jgi:hypothetical protein
MMSEGTRSNHILTTATCNVHEPIETSVSDHGRDYADTLVTTWDAEWIDIGGEG